MLEGGDLREPGLGPRGLGVLYLYGNFLANFSWDLFLLLYW